MLQLPLYAGDEDYRASMTRTHTEWRELLEKATTEPTSVDIAKGKVEVWKKSEKKKKEMNEVSGAAAHSPPLRGHA